MTLDAQNLFSEGQAITAAAPSTNVIDLTSNRDIGTGQNVYLVVSVGVAFTDAGSDSTLTVALEGDSTEAFTPDGTQDLFTFPALSAAGSRLIARLDPKSAPLQFQYIRLLYTPNTGDLTTGSVTAFLTTDVDTYKAYADNSRITG